jgi:hypothetical protein
MSSREWITEGDLDEDIRLLCDASDSILRKLEQIEQLLHNALSDISSDRARRNGA